MSVEKRYCETCKHFRWYIRWQPSPNLVRTLVTLAAPSMGITLLILGVLRYAERRSAWRCKFCGNTFTFGQDSPSRFSDRLGTAHPVNDEHRRQQVFQAKPTKRSNKEFWQWHDRLYLGGSWRSEEWRVRARQVKERDGRRCVLMMQRLVPAFLAVWIDHGAGEDWGPMCYPPLGPMRTLASESKYRTKNPR